VKLLSRFFFETNLIPLDDRSCTGGRVFYLLSHWSAARELVLGWQLVPILFLHQHHYYNEGTQFKHEGRLSHTSKTGLAKGTAGCQIRNDAS
jgi:hypothetical protein